MVCSWVKLLGLVVLWVVTTGGWLDFFKSSKEERIKGESPVAYIERFKGTLKVFGDTRTAASQLVRMNIFGRLHPSYSPAQVREIAGEPIDISSPNSYTTRLVYRSNKGKLFYEAIKVDGGIMHNVSFFPFNTRPDKLLSRKITTYLRPSLQKEDVLIWNCDDDYFQFHAILEEGLLREIIWVDSEAYNRSFGRKERGACID